MQSCVLLRALNGSCQIFFYTIFFIKMSVATTWMNKFGKNNRRQFYLVSMSILHYANLCMESHLSFVFITQKLPMYNLFFLFDFLQFVSEFSNFHNSHYKMLAFSQFNILNFLYLCIFAFTHFLISHFHNSQFQILTFSHFVNLTFCYFQVL